MGFFGGGGGGPLTATVTLTDAQIKALTSVPVQIVANPGTGKVIIPIVAFANFVAVGAYDQPPPGSVLCIGGPNTAPNTFSVNYTVIFGGNPATMWTGPAGPSLVTNPTSSPLALFVDSLAVFGTGPGDVTGGDAANTLNVTVFYEVVSA